MSTGSSQASHSPPPPPRLTLIACVFLPFAAGFFLSYFYRTVNAVIAPDIASDVGLHASDIGLLTSMYFLSFAAFQLPLGILLDRFGPRRVETVLLLVAALGALLFGSLNGLAGLAVGRALIGVGVSCGLMAGFKAFVLWFPAERLPAVNGLMMTFGGLGALASTMPVGLLLHVTSWRVIFLALGAATALLALVVFTVVPERAEPVAHTRIRDQLAGMCSVFRNRFFWRVAPAAAITTGTSVSVQSLWAGPWLYDVQGLDRLSVSQHLMIIAATLSLSYPLIGVMAQRLMKRGVSGTTVAGAGMAGFMLVMAVMASGVTGFAWLLMVAFGFLAAFASLCYALLAQHFPPELVGRANTGLNVLLFSLAFAIQWGLGVIIGHWSHGPGGHYAVEGYRVGFAILASLQALAMLWFFVIARKLNTETY